MHKLLPIGLVVAGLFACESAPPKPTCELNVDNLVGKTFVMSEAQPKGPDKLNPLARMKFVEEDGKVGLRYTAMSLGDIYSYNCEKIEKEGKDPELKCVEPPRLKDWCEALFAHDIKCTKKKLRKLGTEASDEELEKAIAEAKASMAKVKGDEMQLKRWKFMRANLANKLQGQVFAKVDSRCRLKIDDMYWTLKPNGEKVEDTNPVGTNPFVQTDEPWMFEHCDNQAELFDLDKDGFPTLPLAAAPSNALGKPIYYFHTGELASKPEEGCTYSFDTYASWKPLEQNQKPTVDDKGRLIWRAEHTFTKDNALEVHGKTLGLFHMARYKECAGKKSKIDVACRTTVF